MFFVCLGDQNMSQLHYQFNDIVKGSVLVELVDFVLHLLSFMIPHLHSVEITPHPPPCNLPLSPPLAIQKNSSYCEFEDLCGDH